MTPAQLGALVTQHEAAHSDVPATGGKDMGTVADLIALAG